MPRKSKYADAIANYNPQKDGTMKSYCESLGLDYMGFRKAAYLERKKQGLEPRKLTDNKPYCQQLAQSKESVKEFCKRNDLNYENFRMAWYRYRKANNLDIRTRNKKEETE